MKTIHLNSDLGEGGLQDWAIMPHISACNIACGGHAGTLESMQHTVNLALKHQVQIGAHPSYPDKKNFGRLPMSISGQELKRSLVAQVMSLKQIAEAEGAVLEHVKPHGALYNKALKDQGVSEIVVEAILEFGHDIILFAPEHSFLAKTAENKLAVRFEAFADRKYNPDYLLVSREDPQALITEKEDVLKHLLSMIDERIILCKNGEKIPTQASTYCVHSDTPNAVQIVQYLDRELAIRNLKVSKK